MLTCIYNRQSQMTPLKIGNASTIRWNIVYHELAVALAKIRNTYGKRAGSHLHEILTKDPKFLSSNQWFAKYSSIKEQLVDPLVLFASFNASMSKRENRLVRVNNLCRILLDKHFEDIDFSGCPTPIGINLMSLRNKQNQETIWWLFEYALKHGPSFLEESVFERLQYIRGVDIVSFTIFLFWIDSDNFLPLDKNTVGFLIQTGRIEGVPKGYDEYIKLLIDLDLPYLETATIAYQSANITSETSTEKNNIIKEDLATLGVGNFRLIGIKPLPDIDKNLKKVLEFNKSYCFYNAFNIDDFSKIPYDPAKEAHIYSLKNLPINISAIVGKNGNGKSTITELIYIAINLLSKTQPNLQTDLEDIPKFDFELYYIADFLYCIKYINSEVFIYRYKTENKCFTEPTEIKTNTFDLSQFFFTIAINYSFYGLNSRHVGPWVKPLFKKNDGYQLPLTINPYREEGNINVNTEEALTKQRLMTNLLLPVPENEQEMNLRKLTEKANADQLSFKLDEGKFSNLYKIQFEGLSEIKQIGFDVTTKYFSRVLMKVCRKFGIDSSLVPKDITQRTTVIDFAFWYILKKLVSIARTYPTWDYFNTTTNRFSGYITFINRLFDDYSHITYKLRQAINFIKYDHIRKHLSQAPNFEATNISIESISLEIESLLSLSDDQEIETIHLIPPTFLQVSIQLDDGSKLDHLSSGEKQRIYAVNSVVYHLYNLNSVSVKKGFVNYRYVNIIFDEIELYFHPEMQQDFINYLLSYISRITLDRISALNILIITHSPFILSDIPNPNILFLGKVDIDIKTLGSNIHDLLANSFFMEGFMGNHVKKIIIELVDYLSLDYAKEPEYWSRERSLQVINLIGEPLIKQRLLDMHRIKFKEEVSKEKQIEELEIKLKLLKGETNS